jgi:hypothetical protein
MYKIEATTPHELKHGSPWTNPHATLDIDELTTKDFLDGDRVEALDALNKYQTTTQTGGTKPSSPRSMKKETSSSSG